MLVGIRVSNKIGIGDAIQFSSLPENYYRHTGKKLADLESNWIFDYNPFVERNVEKVSEEIDLWHSHCYNTRVQLYGRQQLFANAEAGCAILGVTMILNRPRLYRFEDTKFYDRKKIILQTRGKSHGQLPFHVVKHVIEKYGHSAPVCWLAAPDEEWSYCVPQPVKAGPFYTLWELVQFISEARMLIGPDSGPTWIAQCYPDIVVKKVRMLPKADELRNWVPLEWCRIGSHWDDRSALIFNPSLDDIGFTYSYKRI